MKPKAVIYACSHRKGNTDHAAELLLKGIEEAGGAAEIIRLRKHEVLPCLACGHCDSNVDGRLEDRCVLAQKDEAARLYAPLFTAPVVFFTSPIYFYHLPSRFKTWIDRAQQFWKARMDKEPWVASLPRRKAYSVFVAGRPEGEKLFEGARLSLKFFLWNFNVRPEETLQYRGVDESRDLAAHETYGREIQRMGRDAWVDAMKDND
ncbi:flavodoxin family protein [Salidesulfovibrio onnuriiensis]|uniref:flavodoxin family protein n=1 Tax=Salidesulfovibrio onnuriiensis TaxID=2583823 RepID=UPI0011CBBB52|nr:flavodoxin family protein [Salidesulfovibrio onnuriiensis]